MGIDLPIFAISPAISAVFCLRNRVQFESAAMEENHHLQVLAIAMAAGVFFTVWIFEFSPSLVALVMRWSK